MIVALLELVIPTILSIIIVVPIIKLCEKLNILKD